MIGAVGASPSTAPPPSKSSGKTKVEQKPRAPETPKEYPPKEVQDLSSMSIDELWALHQKVAATLVAKIAAAKEMIADRLRLLDQVRSDDANENNHAG